MKRTLLQWLVCPACHHEFQLEVAREAGREIEEGRLICGGCAATFGIVRGVPRMVRASSDPATQASFGYEWLHVEATDFEEDVVTFFRRTGVDPSLYPLLAHQPKKERLYPTQSECGYVPNAPWLQGKLVLDAGCGLGRYLRVAKDYAQTVIGVDFSDAVNRAHQIATTSANVHVLQADLTALPFRPETFDFVYSIGVLHHTPNPRQTFRRLAPVCRPGGGCAVTVYGHDYWIDPIRGTITKGLRMITTRLPHRFLLWWCRVIGGRLGAWQMWAAERPLAKWLLAPIFLVTIPRHRKPGVMIGDTFDVYSPKHIWVYRPDEVSRWLREEGFQNIHILQVPTSVSVLGMERAVEVAGSPELREPLEVQP